MKIKKLNCLLFLACISTYYAGAQSFVKDITISAGEGYSPGFDGSLSFGVGTVYPVENSFQNNANADNYPYPCDQALSYTNNMGGFVDVKIKWNISVGVGASYQSAVMEWAPYSNGPGGNYVYVFSDKVTRTNLGVRILYHYPNYSKHFDVYAGIRIGQSYWHDTPSDSNTVKKNVTVYTNYFLESQNMVVPSFQMLTGLRFYFSDALAIHLEAAVGSPYVLEGGVTFRINLAKDELRYGFYKDTTPTQSSKLP